jgi:hypothetical protein
VTRGRSNAARAIVSAGAAGGFAFGLLSGTVHAAALDDPRAVVSPSGFSVRWITDSSEAKQASVEVSGFTAAALKQLRNADWNREQWQRLLAVYAEQGDLLADVGLPPMLGAYRLTTNSLRFEPQFPLEAGVQYRATFWPGRWPGQNDPAAPPRSAVFQLPERNAAPTTVVTQVYPSASVVPENLLKFYVQFSAAMSRGHIYDHIHLLDEAGKAVELPFLEIDEELWNPDLTRLTLFIDPGRIKRGVKPLEDIGPAMEAGKRYTLVIDRGWKDGDGRPLKESFRKSFQVGPTDREPPDPGRWKILPPKAGTREPLAVAFPEPMDHALAQRLIHVRPSPGDERARLSGRSGLEDQERRWTFVPAQAWGAGRYQLAVPTTIEDLAGNNIGKPFEVDTFEGVERRITNQTVSVPFEIR